MTSNALARPPDPEEIEVSLFGNGYGEAVAVHVGRGAWIIIDSCLGESGSVPVTLGYLAELEVDPAEAVELVVASHWHDDHVRGLSKVVKACPRARFACSSLLETDQFAMLLAVCGRGDAPSPSGVEEFRAIVSRLRDPARPGPVLACAGKCLYRSAPGAGPSCSLSALSPTDAAVWEQVTRLAENVCEGGHRRALAPRGPNVSGVVCLLEVEGKALLFGGNMEAGAKQGSGWEAIVSEKTRPDTRAQVFKVPHHGSVTGDLPEIWTELVASSPWALLTTFRLGRTTLPTRRDAGRLLGHTKNASIAGPTQAPRETKRRERSSQRFLREMGITMTERRLRTGQVRLPFHPRGDDSPRVEYFGEAAALREAFDLGGPTSR